VPRYQLAGLDGFRGRGFQVAGNRLAFFRPQVNRGWRGSPLDRAGARRSVVTANQFRNDHPDRQRSYAQTNGQSFGRTAQRDNRQGYPSRQAQSDGRGQRWQDQTNRQRSQANGRAQTQRQQQFNAQRQQQHDAQRQQQVNAQRWQQDQANRQRAYDSQRSQPQADRQRQFNAQRPQQQYRPQRSNDYQRGQQRQASPPRQQDRGDAGRGQVNRGQATRGQNNYRHNNQDHGNDRRHGG
jgi:hypothetical protein